jgi:hypothetical protein
MVEASLCSRFSSLLARCHAPSPLYHFHAKQRRQRSTSVLKIHTSTLRPFHVPSVYVFNFITLLLSRTYWFFFSFYTVHFTNIKLHISTFHPFHVPSVFTSLFIPLLLGCTYWYFTIRYRAFYQYCRFDILLYVSRTT